MSLAPRVMVVVGFLAIAAAGQQATQTLPAGFLTQDAPDLTAWPFSAQTPQRWQWIYDSTAFQNQGPITIHEISVRLAFAGLPLQAFSVGDVTVRLGSSATHYGQKQTEIQFDDNLLSDAVTVRSGPFNGGPVFPPPGATVGAWVPLGLQSPFVFDPTLDNDLVVELRTDAGNFSAPLDVATAAVGENGGNRYGSTFSRVATNWNFTHVSSESVPVVKIDYSVGGVVPAGLGPQWQRNNAGATLSIDGVTQPPTQPVLVQGPLHYERCVGQPGLANIQGAGVGLPWEFGFVPSPPLPGNQGGVITSGRQALSLPIFTQAIFWLNGLLFTNPLVAPSIDIPFNLFNTGSFMAQMLSFDPAAVDGFNLSAPLVVDVLPVGTAALNPADDDFEFLSFDAPPLCTLATFDFYGVTFDGMYVSTNGRITFGDGDADFVPSVASALTDPPFVGLWTDLQPNVAGSVVVNISTGPSVRVTYNQIPYFGQPASSSSFVLRLNIGSGDLWIQGLNGVPAGSQPAFLGLSAGLLGATDPGPTTFTVGAGPTPGANRPMLYEFGTVGTLASGVSDLQFSPIPGGYAWTGF